MFKQNYKHLIGRFYFHIKLLTSTTIFNRMIMIIYLVTVNRQALLEPAQAHSVRFPNYPKSTDYKLTHGGNTRKEANDQLKHCISFYLEVRKDIIYTS